VLQVTLGPDAAVCLLCCVSLAPRHRRAALAGLRFAAQHAAANALARAPCAHPAAAVLHNMHAALEAQGGAAAAAAAAVATAAANNCSGGGAATGPPVAQPTAGSGKLEETCSRYRHLRHVWAASGSADSIGTGAKLAALNGAAPSSAVRSAGYCGIRTRTGSSTATCSAPTNQMLRVDTGLDSSTCGAGTTGDASSMRSGARSSPRSGSACERFGGGGVSGATGAGRRSCSEGRSRRGGRDVSQDAIVRCASPCQLMGAYANFVRELAPNFVQVAAPMSL
jgi:hypothetical protein